MQINVYVQIQNRIIIMEKLHTISCEAVKFQIIKFNSNVIHSDGQLDVGTSFIKLSSHMVCYSHNMQQNLIGLFN